MIRAMHRTITLAALLLLLAACGDAADSDTTPAAPSPSPTRQAETDTQVETDAERKAREARVAAAAERVENAEPPPQPPVPDVEAPPAPPEPRDPEATYRFAVDGGTWQGADVTLDVGPMWLATCEEVTTAAGGGFGAPSDCEEGGETVVALDMAVENARSGDITFHPDQSTLVLGSEQIESSLFDSPGDVGGDLLAGTEHQGQIWWVSTQDVDDIAAMGTARLVFSAPHTSDFEDLVEDYEQSLTLKWDPEDA